MIVQLMIVGKANDYHCILLPLVLPYTCMYINICMYISNHPPCGGMVWCGVSAGQGALGERVGAGDPDTDHPTGQC